MAVTKEDLRDFIRFADEKVASDEADSLLTLAYEWEARRSDRSDSHRQISAYTLRTLAGAFSNSEDKAKLQQAFARRGGVTTAQLLENAKLATCKVGHTSDLQEKLEMRITDIGLDSRTAYCLEQQRILTVDSLLHRTMEELLNIPNFTQTMLEEIYKALESIGFYRPEGAIKREDIRI